MSQTIWYPYISLANQSYLKFCLLNIISTSQWDCVVQHEGLINVMQHRTDYQLK